MKRTLHPSNKIFRSSGLKIFGSFGLLLLLILWAAASCKVTQPYQRPAGTGDNGLYRDTTITDTTTIANIPWKQMFPDTLLQSLIQEGIDHNYDLKIAIARISEAAANFRQSKAAF